MTRISGRTGADSSVEVELGRILLTGVLAVVCIALSLLIDSPVSILAWMLHGVALLSLVYVVLASRQLLIQIRSQHQKADSNG